MHGVTGQRRKISTVRAWSHLCSTVRAWTHLCRQGSGDQRIHLLMHGSGGMGLPAWGCRSLVSSPPFGPGDLKSYSLVVA